MCVAANEARTEDVRHPLLGRRQLPLSPAWASSCAAFLLPSVILWGPEREPVQNVAQSSMPFLLVALLRSFPLFLLDLIQNCFWRYVALDLADF
jgi:hypothetical protein